MILLLGILLLSTSVISIILLAYLAYFIFMWRVKSKELNWKTENVLQTQFVPKVSLIIATYNEEATLPRKLQNVLNLDYPKEKLELVFIDSGSTDKTSDLIESFVSQHPQISVVFIQEKERLGKSHAVNIAYPKASGYIKIISDADAMLEKSAITKIVSDFSNPTVGAACGRQVLLNAEQNSSTLLEKSYRSIYEVLREGESILDSTPIFHGELSAYRADLIEQLPENKSADDSRLANIIRQRGYRAVYDPEAVFYEYAPPTSSSRIIQKVRRGQGLIRVFWDFKYCLFNSKCGKYGTLIFPMEFFMHCIFPGLLLFFFGVFSVGLAFYSYPFFLIMVVLFGCIVALSKLRSKVTGLSSGVRFSSFFTSFTSSQLILLYALILWVSGRSLHKWQKVNDIRQEWQNTKA